ncbi:MAG: 50S ribosomal protein L32e, partial [Candidatus Methanomethyliaceae archaeon]|nr:50S ribosomal protein L32e [Candidatus Methanomethyliaceae archaeon]
MSSTSDVQKALELREKISRRRPDFTRQEANRFPRLGEKWRSPKGPRSKMRLKKAGRAAIVEPGYRGPRIVRGFHPCGKREILVHNPKELDGLNPSLYVVRIASSVGRKKRLE